MNYYCKNRYEEYLKLRDFMKTNQINLKVALMLTLGSGVIDYHKFRMGEYVFESDAKSESLEICWDTVSYIKKMNGYSQYTTSARFWQALLRIIQHPEFLLEKWQTNLERFVDRVRPQARIKDYLNLLLEIYNYRNHNKITVDMKGDKIDEETNLA